MKKVAIVTGASSGIGKAISHAMISRNYCVIANGRTIKKADFQNDNVIISNADLLDEKTPKDLLDLAIKSFGGLNYLFVNAGTIESGSIHDIDINKMCKMLRLKVESSFRLIYTVLKYLLEKDSGHIIITSSVLGTKTREHSGAYAACNFALEALAESLRMELSHSNIKITCIEPGLVKTGLHRDCPIHPQELLGISNTLNPQDIVEVVTDILDKPDHIRIPKYMILPKGHKI